MVTPKWGWEGKVYTPIIYLYRGCFKRSNKVIIELNDDLGVQCNSNCLEICGGLNNHPSSY